MSELKEKPDLLAQWQDAKAALDAAKALESELREQIVARYFKDAVDAGTYHRTIGNRDVALKKTFNYKLEPTQALAAQHTVAGMIGQPLAQRLMRWKPELSISEYKKLPDEARAVIDEALTITPAKPTIEVK